VKLPFILARRFVAAETLEDTLPVVADLNARGMTVALDRLGEYTTNREAAEIARDAYIDLVGTIRDGNSGRPFEANISIKLSAMGQKIDHAFCVSNLRRLLEAAQKNDVFVRLDMEGSDVTASTLKIFESVFPEYPEHVGPVLQAYLHRTARDVDRMCELGARVRICKGAYREPSAIAYQEMDRIRERFLVYARQLIQHAPYPGIATHDRHLIRDVQAFARAERVPADRFEFQMLYGIRPEWQQRIVDDGYRMRIYVPYGTEWFPYFVRRLRERKENVWFVARHLFVR
jgi:proline dehydrogenase